MFGKKSKIEQIKELMKDLTDEELTELKSLIGGDAEEEQPAEEEVKTEDEVQDGESKVETKEEVKTEETTPEENPEDAGEETPPEAPAEETPAEAPGEEAPAQEGEAQSTETDAVEEAKNEADENAQVIGALKSQIDSLTELVNNLTAKVEPILQKFEEIDGAKNPVGLGKDESVADEEDENLTAYQRALKHAKY